MPRIRRLNPAPADIPRHFFQRLMPETRPAPVRVCEYPGCSKPGDYKAPRRHFREERQGAPQSIIEEKEAAHRWFCLEHVKEFNAAWNYYEGLDAAGMEQAIRHDTVWNRPSWPFGHWGPRRRKRYSAVNGNGREKTGAREEDSASARKNHATARAALAELGLEPPVEFPAVKRRYRELVKRHHPDVKENGHGPAARAVDGEAMLRLNAAFTFLKALYAERR